MFTYKPTVFLMWLLVYLVFTAQNNKIQGTFLKKDDPKISALMQQAELLSSLALKVDTENMDQSLENAWKVRLDSFRTCSCFGFWTILCASLKMNCPVGFIKSKDKI